MVSAAQKEEIEREAEEAILLWHETKVALRDAEHSMSVADRNLERCAGNLRWLRENDNDK